MSITSTHFSHNGQLLPIAEATIPLDNVAYSYGYGVYETVRAVGSQLYFLDQHCARLLGSAQIIGLEHSFSASFIADSARALIEQNQLEACNVKVLLIGGHSAEAAQLYIQCLNPLFPDRRLYREGVHTITVDYERPYPHAKSLNMLPSYLAYRDARRAGAYDALLIDHNGNITEGTRTNFFAMQGKTIISPPAEQILLGVTRDNVLRVAGDNGFEVVEQDIPLASVDQHDAVFLTSTSAKIMPIHSINDMQWDGVASALQELMAAFNHFLDELH